MKQGPAWSCLGLAGHELKFASPPEDAAAVRAVGTRPLPKDRVLLRKKQKKILPDCIQSKKNVGERIIEILITSCHFM